VQLGQATWSEVAATAGRAIVAFPVGSLEQHGPHLPLDTDTRIAVALVDALARRRTDVAAAPPLAYGASGEHADFPGTLLIDHHVLAGVVVELVRSARAAFGGVVFVSAHGGNAEGLALAEGRCRDDGDDVLFWRAHGQGGDAHAGRTETSLMLAIDPSRVRLELAEAGCTEPIEAVMPRLRAEGVRPISSNGVLGDPAGANAAEGHELLARLAEDLAASVTARWPRGASRS